MEYKRPINYTRLLPHLLFWLAYFMYQAMTYGWENTDVLSFKLAPQIIYLGVPVTILLTYINLYVLIPLYYSCQKYVRYSISLVLMLLVGGLLQRYITYQFIIPWEHVHDPVRYAQEKKNFWIPVRILRISLEAFPVIAIAMLITLMQRAYQQEKNMRAIEKEKYSAEMGLLKAQINPHFFFNTLNSLYALTLQASDRAPKVVLRLSELMSYMLYDASAERVHLVDEISHLENYIGIEQMRFADRLEISFQHSGDIAGKMIAPLLLLPFVENAFKHGITGEAAWITIDLKVMGKQLFFKVENSFTANPEKSGHGLGLANLQRRLDLTYPGNYELKLNENERLFEADLKLNL